MSVHVNEAGSLADIIPAGIPAVGKVVATRLKKNPLANASLLAERREGNVPVLATWTYGLGRTAVLTTDVTGWTDQWEDRSERDQFLAELVRWSLKPQ